MLTFWIIAVALTLIACLAVLLPVVSRQHEAAADASFDIEVYRDQLAEIEADETRGLIGGDEAAEARAEIGRRILKTSEQDGTEKRSAATQTARWLALAAVAAVPLLSWGIYSVTGSPGLPGQPLQARLEKNPAENTIEELIARAEGHLAANPGDGRGWDVIAPIYVRVQRYGDAVIAYRNAIRIIGSDARRQAGLGEALAAQNGGAIGADAREAFEKALAHEPDDSKAKFFLAVADAQAGKLDEAIAAWQALIGDAPENSPWRVAASRALETAMENRKTAIEPPSERGPDAGDIAAAQEMPAEDRAAMIDTMVAGLAARLEENPLDREGWQKLIRSYVVLGRLGEARSALARGRDALQEVPGGADALEAFAAGLGVMETD